MVNKKGLHLESIFAPQDYKDFHSSPIYKGSKPNRKVIKRGRIVNRR